ncbi:MAG: fibronectin type III domain-containing protein, partial [Bacteroidales bacterium]|nr:fibronectin type III domain-containing protein [Bacteroidales bacterium]
IHFVGSGNYYLAGNSFYNIVFGGTGTYTATGTLYIYGFLTINNHFNAGSYTHYIYGNWTNNGTFVYSTCTIVFNGTVQQIIGGIYETVFYNFIVDNPSGILLNGNLTVNNVLTLTLGIVTTGVYTFTVLPSGSITGGSATAYIYGKLVCGFNALGSRFFPVGNAGYYGPLVFNYITLTGTSLVQVEFLEGVIPGSIPGFITHVAQRYWVISQTGGSNFTFTVTLDVPGFTPAGTVWMLKGDGAVVNAFATTAPNYTNSEVFSTMGDFTLGDEVCADPYGLTYTDITYTTATLYWEPGYLEQSWNLEYGPAGFTPGTGTMLPDVTSRSLLITGLSPHSYYEFYVQAICSDLLQSNWAGPAPFATFPKQLDIQVLLEGPYNGGSGEMNTILSNTGIVPLSHPYQGAPWNYAGTEQVTSIPSGVVDWVLVEWRDAPTASAATGATVIGRRAGFLMSDGTIADTDGNSLILIGDPQLSGSLFVVVQHRNHLEIMSSGGMQLTGDIYSWDFTGAAAQAYGGILAQKQLASGQYGMVSGDGNANGEVNNNDKNDVWRVQAGLSGYMAGDFSLDGETNTVDKVEKWAPNTGSASQVPE